MKRKLRLGVLALSLATGSLSGTLSLAQQESHSRPLAPIPAATSRTFQESISDGALSNRIVSYKIDATLDPAPGTKTVVATEHITWRNPGERPVAELQFHLYLNAFRDAESTFMTGSGGKLRDDEMPSGKFGNIEITSMKTSDGTDLLPGLEFIHPDDENANDRTVARVPLPTPVSPGATLAIDVGFTAKLPGIFARTGYKDNFFLVAQWYPKLGVYEPRGMRGRTEEGWNCHQFHPNSEFYADFGSFDVSLTVPSNFVVGATGTLAEEVRNPDGTTTRRFQQSDVHDFAWTADDDYLVAKRTYTRPGFPTVDITALVQPRHASTVERHLDACVASLDWFNRNIGAYPYSTLTVVDPEEGAGGAGGMEYPTLITAGIEEFVSGHSPAPDDPLLELVIFHEFGHQYWYGMVASNEFEEPWLDEGINSYTESLGLEEIWPNSRRIYLAFGGRPMIRIPIETPVAGPMTRYAALPQNVRRGPLINTSWGFAGNYNYGVNTYPRTAVTLRTLRGLIGAETMDRVMRTYFDRWKFRHPTSQDFFDTASEVSGRDLTWFFDQFFRSDAVLDYAVQEVTEKRIILERRGDAIFPVLARVWFEDGTTRDLEWDGLAAQQVFPLDGGSRATRVEIDPAKVVMLDANFTNNSWVADVDDFGALRFASQLTLFLQQIAATFAGAI